MNLTLERHGTVCVVHMGDSRIDAACATRFKDRFRDLAGAAGGPVVLDLSRVDFLDSSGLGAVVAMRKFLGEGRPLELAGLRPPVDKVMQLTRMNTVFAIHESRAAALAAHAHGAATGA